MTQFSSSLPSPSPVPARASLPTGKRIRVLVVDDSVVMRQLLTRMLASDQALEVVGSARDGVDAVAKVAQLQPDLVTLDVEMPQMDGLEALRLIQARHPKVRVIMCSSLTARGAAVTIDALLAGASDYVTKQQSSSLSGEAYEVLRFDLLAKVRQLFALGGATAADPLKLPGTALVQSDAAGIKSGISVTAAKVPYIPASPLSPPNLRALAPSAHKLLAPQILAIGVSTGGPAALAEIMPLIPAGFPIPIAIVQHMPPFFTQLLAERLSKISNIAVVEGTHGMELKPGVAVVAPGNFHMRAVKRLCTVHVELNQQEQENSCRPAVDVLFRSIAEVYGGAAIAMILTGMGQDGLLGVRALKALGAPILVQDSTTSVVWGMPGAVATARLADAVLPLRAIIPEVLRRL